LYAAKADLLRRAGANDEAILAYQQALTLVSNESERRYLQRRLQEVLGVVLGFVLAEGI
jgi:RNA polymerase sigma-70 factor (ECF subfamily)